MNTALPTGVDVVVAAQTLGQTVRRTPLDLSLRLSGIRRQSVLLKREDIQVGRSYKVRGAYNFISGLPANEREAGIVCASAGNHAQGVAFACRQLKIHGKVFLPSTTPRQKRARIADIGGRWIEQIVGGAAFDEASSAAMEYADAHGATYVHPFDDPRTIAGQGTVVKELFEQASEKPATVVVPVGGGGLASGIALAVKLVNPQVKVIGVEPENAACMKAALSCGRTITLPSADTVADGCAVRTAGKLTLEFCRRYLDEIITVSEMEIMSALLSLIEKHKLIAEGAGVLSLAALQKLRMKDKKIAVLISGGNIDISTISALISKALISRGRVFRFSVQLPDKPGQLLTVAQILTEQDANVIRLDHDQTMVTDSFQKVQLTVTVEAHGQEHIDRIVAALASNGFEINKIY